MTTKQQRYDQRKREAGYPRVELRLPVEQIKAIDAIRGERSRSAYVEGVLRVLLK